MKIVVIGGSGLIGSKVVTCLADDGHDAVSAALDTGVNTVTGEGLTEAVTGADVVIDVSNSPSYDDAAALDFFETSTRNLIEAEADAAVRHHLVLSIVGSEHLHDSAYMRAKVAQEKLVSGSAIPHTIVHATQFFEFATGIADHATDGSTVRVPAAFMQPMAADDAAAAVCEAALAAPLNGVLEVGGPEQLTFVDFVGRRLEALGDPRTVVADPGARYFGARLGERTLVPDDTAVLGPTRFADWLTAEPARS